MLAFAWVWGLWEAAAAVGGSRLVTTCLTAAAMLLAAWAIAVLRKR